MTESTSTRTRTLAVGYARRSTDRQEQSIADQKRAVEAYARERGYDILDWYVDDAISGASADGREAFLSMIEDAQGEGRPFGCVLVYDVKRFGRLDNDETGHYRYLLKRAGVDVVYVSEGFNGDDSDDLIRPVKQWQARQELKDLSKVTIRGLVSKCRAGSWLGGIPPYGYDLAHYSAAGEFLMTVRYMQDGSKQVLGADGTVERTLAPGQALRSAKQDRTILTPSAAERVETVRKMFSWYVREGMGYKGIAARLNLEGIPAPRNGRRGTGKWSMSSVREIVGNPAYTGDMTWNRRSMAKFHRVQGGGAVPMPRIRRTSVIENDERDWVVMEASHEAIVTREVFRAAQARRKERCKAHERGYRRGRGAKSDYLLTGLVRCARCGESWQGHTHWKGRRRQDGSAVVTKYYACSGYVTKGRSVCRRAMVRKEILEGMVLDEVRRGISRFLEGEEGREALKALLGEMLCSGAEGASEELERLRTQKADVERRINGILDNITEVNREFADRRILDLRRELGDILPRLAMLEETTGAALDLDALTEQAMRYMESFEAVFVQGTVDEKRTFLHAFVHRITLDPEDGTGKVELYPIPRPASLAPASGGADASGGNGGKRTAAFSWDRGGSSALAKK